MVKIKLNTGESLRTEGMEDLSVVFLNLDPPGKRHVHTHLCQNALLIWEAYARQQPSLDYVDAVVGLQHGFDVMLPRAALDSVRSGSKHEDIAYRYQEPIAALQDDDIVFPAHIEFAYYAIYNLYKKYIQGDVIDDWLIVNQALSAEEDPSQWRPLLTEALEKTYLYTTEVRFTTDRRDQTG